jgi:hypothetical protein
VAKKRIKKIIRIKKRKNKKKKEGKCYLPWQNTMDIWKSTLLLGRFRPHCRQGREIRFYKLKK